jgi:hypothetical protein
MSREQLVNSYIDGGLNRRAFIRRLVAAGVSVGAAASYAQLLAPEAKADAQIALNDHYPEVDVRIRSRSLDRVQNRGVVRVRVVVSGESARVFVGVDLQKKNGKRILIGQRQVVLNPGVHIVKVKLTEKGRKLLAGRERAKLNVTATAHDRDAADSGISDTAVNTRRLRN